MSLRINDEAPNFTAETTEGTITFHDWIGDGWAILFSHPKDFTPICTTELGYMAGLKPDFESRNCKVIGISVDGVSDHEKWSQDIEKSQGHAVNYPLIGDPQLKVVKLFDMLPADAGDAAEGRTAADNATARSVFIIGPDKKIKAMLTYPMSTGRNFDEILRLLDSCQLTAKEQGRHAGELEAGRGRGHPAGRVGRAGEGQVSRRVEVAVAVSADRARAEVSTSRVGRAHTAKRRARRPSLAYALVALYGAGGSTAGPDFVQGDIADARDV